MVQMSGWRQALLPEVFHDFPLLSRFKYLQLLLFVPFPIHYSLIILSFNNIQ